MYTKINLIVFFAVYTQSKLWFDYVFVYLIALFTAPNSD